MKELRKIKLINWHYFTNTELEIAGSTLITGDNGSGKSTIIDALQFVLVGDLRQIKFNVSAHDETKRNLVSYLRCKTGSDDGENGDEQKYLRQGDITTYIALEFYDQKKKESFIIGVVVDSYADDLTYRHNFFKIEKQKIEDELFITDNRPRNIKEFRRYIRSYQSNIYPGVEQYREDLLVKFGSISERFFSLFVKAISFKPITDIREFVYSYVLDEKPVNIETMKENFERYRNYSELVAETKKKIADLEVIRNMFSEIEHEKERAVTHDYLILRARAEGAQLLLEQTIKEKEEKEAKLKRVDQDIEIYSGKEENLQEKLIEYRASLQNNSVYQLLQELEKEIKDLKEQQSSLKNRSSNFIARLKEEAKSLNQLLITLERVQAEGFFRESGLLTNGDSLLTSTERELITDFIDKLARLEQLPIEELSDYDFEEVKRVLLSLNGRIRHTLWLGQQQEVALKEDIEKLKEDIQTLKQNRRVYDRKVTDLQAIIRERFREEKGLEVEPQILCELLEIPDQRWQDAVEGFLNTQRFDLIIEPAYFDFALAVYERYKREKNIHGVGLVNTAKVLTFRDRFQKDSLAAEVVSENKYARGYVNQLMGNLIKCENEQELKNHQRAITPTCMTYLNNTARQINFRVYETPYIGQRAIKRQLEQKERKLAGKEEVLKRLRIELKVLKELDNLSSGKEELYYRFREDLTAISSLVEVSKELSRREDELARLDTSDIDNLKEEISRLNEEKERLRQQLNKLREDKGELKSVCQMLEDNIINLQLNQEQAVEEYEQFQEYHQDILTKFHERYQAELKEKGSHRRIEEVFTSSRKGIDTIMEKKVAELRELQYQYNNTYQFGAPVTGETIEEYEEEYHKLSESELPDYEEKINIARKEAEEEFKEHFVYKLKENIDNARTEFKYLNEALKDIEFGEDRYRFIVTPAESHRKFYDMIMDSYLFEGSLFDQVFQEKHSEAMDELFERILYESADYLQENIIEYTDYRTFLDYDIKIYHSNGETSTFSRVCLEKSGGETQTPYYVAIIASFMQLYRIKSNDRSIRLMVFDEAFNRMDSERIEKTLKFMTSLELQYIIAAPTEKCEYITPYLPTTLLMFRSGHHSWVEDYKQLKLDEVF